MDALLRPDPLPLTISPWHVVFRRVPGASVRSVPASQTLNRGRMSPELVGLVIEGLVAAVVTTRDGKRACLAVLGPGELIDADPLLAALADQGALPTTRRPPRTEDGGRGKPSSRTDAGSPQPDAASPQPEAWALCRARIAFVHAVELLRVVASDPDSAIVMIAALARAIERRDRSLVRAVSLPVGGRLLAALSEIGRSHGRPTDDAVRIELDLTQDVLAALVGATREAVNRALAVLVREGRIRRVGGRYELPRFALVREARADRSGPS